MNLLQVQSRHAVRNADGRVIYDKGKTVTDEKRHICEHFTIQVDNPTVILQQEEAKTFFSDSHSSNPDKRLERRLYDFFFKGTMLASAVSDYKKARQDHTDAEGSMELKGDHKTQCDEEEEKMRRLYELMLKLNKHDNPEMMTAKQLGRNSIQYKPVKDKQDLEKLVVLHFSPSNLTFMIIVVMFLCVLNTIQIIKARNAEAEAATLSDKIQRDIEKANRAEEQRKAKEDELKKMEREYEEGMLKKRRTEETVEELSAERKRASEAHKAATARLREQEQKLEEGKIQGDPIMISS